MSWRRGRSRYGSRATSSSSSATSVRVPAELEVGLDPVLERRKPKLLEMRRGAADWIVGEVGERRASPQRQCLGEPLGRDGRLGPLSLVDEPQEAGEIELVPVDPEHVARGPCDQPLPELLSQPAEVVVQRRKGRRRRCVTPHAVDELVDRHHAVRVEQQERQHRPPSRSAERQDALAVAHLERAEDPELHPRGA